MKRKALINLWVAIVLTLLVGSAVAPAQASTLPPRAEDVVIRNEDDGNDENNADGAYIELRVQPDLGGLWTVVQWQDGMGRWHDVDGWRTQVEADQVVNWWVAPRDLDTGPYRWLVYQDQDHRTVVVWASELFYLPKRGETLVVNTAVSMRPAPDRPDFKPMMPPDQRPHDSVMPEKERQPYMPMPEKHSQPDPLMPETGSSLGATPQLVTTVSSAIAALALVAGGLVAAFRRGFTI